MLRRLNIHIPTRANAFGLQRFAYYGAAFWILLLLAAALRFYALPYGLPCYTRIDEEAIMAQLTRLWYVPGPDEVKTFYLYYPTHFAHVLGLYWFPRYLLAKSASPGLTYATFLNVETMRPAVQISERMLSAFCGVLVAFPLFRLGMLIRGRRTALFAVALWAVAYMPVRDAHFGVTDQLAALAATWALLACIRYHQERTLTSAILAGVCVGWAIASKYVFASGMLLVVAHFWGCPAEQRWGRPARWLLLSCGAAILVLTPEFVFHPWEFINVIRAMRYWNRTYAHILPIGWVYFGQFTLRYGLGISVMLAALFGAIAALQQRHRPMQLTLCWCGLYYLFAGSQHGVFSRHLNPILPSLCLIAAYGVSMVYRAVESRWNGRSAILAAGGLAVLCLGTNLANSLALLRVLKQEDTRILAMRWIRQNVKDERQIAVSGLWLGFPESLRLRFENLIPAHKKMNLKTLRAQGISYVMTTEYVPQMTYVTPSALLQELQTDPACHRVAVFSPFPEHAPTAPLIVEIQDDWFLPFANISAVGRPGPLLTIYRVQ